MASAKTAAILASAATSPREIGDGASACGASGLARTLLITSSSDRPMTATIIMPGTRRGDIMPSGPGPICQGMTATSTTMPKMARMAPEMIRRVARFMSFETGGKEIRFQLDLPEDPIRVSLDVRQMEQVLINILKNSIEAIEKTGDIRIGLKRNPVRLEIIDTGPGIPPDKEQEVFAYFFSTKSGGQGVGLILVREILINHGFGFSLSTNGESGAVFRIEFERANR